jgi:hypothetical protein
MAETFIILWDEPFPFILGIIPYLVFYQPSCHSCSHLAIIFKFADAKILPGRWKHDSNSSNLIVIRLGSFVTKLYAMETYFLTQHRNSSRLYHAAATVTSLKFTLSLVFTFWKLPQWKVGKLLLLALSFLSARLKKITWRMAERIFMKFDTGEFSTVFGQNSI